MEYFEGVKISSYHCAGLLKLGKKIKNNLLQIAHLLEVLYCLGNSFHFYLYSLNFWGKLIWFEVLTVYSSYFRQILISNPFQKKIISLTLPTFSIIKLPPNFICNFCKYFCKFLQNLFSFL